MRHSEDNSVRRKNKPKSTDCKMERWRQPKTCLLISFRSQYYTKNEQMEFQNIYLIF